MVIDSVPVDPINQAGAVHRSDQPLKHVSLVRSEGGPSGPFAVPNDPRAVLEWLAK